MARDYKDRVSTPPAARPPPVWVWLLTGYLLGGFTVGLIWLKLAPAPADDSWVSAAPGADASAGRAAPAAPERPPPPQFDFYTLLPTMEVEVPAAETPPPPPSPQPPPSPPARPPTPAATTSSPATAPAAPADAEPRYLLQVGSFRQSADADRLKAELALLGFEASVQRVATAQGAVWHRVRVGPYRGEATTQRIRQRLQSSGVEALVVRVPD